MSKSFSLVFALIIFAVILLHSFLLIAQSQCIEGCRNNYSMDLQRCENENFSFFQSNMMQVCVTEAYNEYDSCMRMCPGNTIGEEPLPSNRVEPLSPYSPEVSLPQ